MSIQPVTQPAIVAASAPQESRSCCQRTLDCLKKALEWVIYVVTCGYCFRSCRNRVQPTPPSTATTIATTTVTSTSNRINIRRAPAVARRSLRSDELNIRSSGDTLNITVARRALIEQPVECLLIFAGAITLHTTNIRVEFAGEPGIDASGPSREFITLLREGFERGVPRQFNLVDVGHLKTPKAMGEYEENSGVLPILSREEREIYHAFGKLIGFCFKKNTAQNANQVYLGQRFPQQKFEAICGGTEDPYELAECLNENPDIAGSERQQRFFRIVFRAIETNSLNSSDFGKYTNEFEFYGITETSSSENINRCKEAILRRFGGYVAPMIAIKQGLDELELYGLSGVDLMDRVQGYTDPTAVARAIVYEGSNAEVRRKITWLKEWVVASTTSRREIEQMLVAITGSPVLPPENPRIRINNGNPETLLNIHTCFSSMDVSPRAMTKQDWINAFKAILTGDNATSYNAG